jgi:3-oxoacyl-[acyl-carrier protein] reductase
VDLGLTNATAVVSGGSRGMGRAVAQCLASEGARVAVLARGPAALSETVDDLADRGIHDPIGISTDLLSNEAVSEAFRSVMDRWGPLNVLVNAAGPVDIGVGEFDSIDDDEWQATFDIGVLSAVRCVRAALPLMRMAAWGRIVNISAHSTRRQSPGLVAYTAAKSALTSLSKNLAEHLAPSGILVNTVSPGTFLSEGLKTYLRSLPPERAADPDSLIDAMRIIDEDFGHPAHLGRAGDPSEIGPVIAFLSSQANTYITGANLNVDGGSDFS